MPRGRLIDQDGNSREFRSEIVPRYARRTLGGVPGRGEHAADPQGTVAVARSGAPVQERDLSGRGPLEGTPPSIGASAICQSSGSRSPTWTACT